MSIDVALYVGPISDWAPTEDGFERHYMDGRDQPSCVRVTRCKGAGWWPEFFARAPRNGWTWDAEWRKGWPYATADAAKAACDNWLQERQ